MAQKTLSVKLSLNDKQFQSSLRKATRSMKRFGQSMKRTGQTLSRNLTLPIVAMGTASVIAFDKQAKAIAQVEAGLKSTGNAAGFTSEQLQKMASELQAKTLFGDEDILQNATAQLLTFTNIAGKEFSRTQKVVADLATKSFKGDLKSASIQLGKALNDPVANLSALSRAGIQFTKEQKELIKSLVETNKLADAQSIILDELETQFGGAAEAAANAGLGPFQQLRNSLGDVSEEFGKLIMENIEPLKAGLLSLIEFLRNLTTEQKKTTLKVAAFVAVIGPLLMILGSIITSVGSVLGAFGKLRLFFMRSLLPIIKLLIKGFMNLTPQGRIISGVLLAASYLVTNWGKVKKGFDDLIESAQKLLTKLGLLEKKEDLALDFSVQEGEVLTVEELRRRAAGRQGVKIVPKKQVSPEEEERQRQMGIDKAKASQLQFAESIKVTSVALKEVKNDFATLEPIIIQFEESVSGIDLAVQEMNTIFGQFGSSIQGAFVTALQSTDGFFVSLIDGIKRAVNEMLSLLLVTAIFNALLGGTGMGALMGLKDIGGFRGIGDVFGRSVVGETPDLLSGVGARSMINTGGTTEVFGVISGADILLSSDRAQANRNRTRGY
jgi:hypothetical protein